jgi:hypothetical protein
MLKLETADRQRNGSVTPTNPIPVKLMDGDGNGYELIVREDGSVEVTIVGVSEPLSVSDLYVKTVQQETLELILLELQKLNTHMSFVTDEHIREEDVICT